MLLAKEHFDILHRESAICQRVIKERGYWTATIPRELIDLGFSRTQARVPALVLPVWNYLREAIQHQIRPDNPRCGKQDKPVKYETPKNSRLVIDVPPTVGRRVQNPNLPLFITEGIKKGDALASQGLTAVALFGVYGFRGTNEHGGKTALADWEDIALNGRAVYIVFDHDVMLNPSVYSALARLKAFLESRQAKVNLIYLPAVNGDPKTGVDDFFAVGHTVDDLLAYAQSELIRPPSSEQEKPPVPYIKTSQGFFYIPPMGILTGANKEQLTNFQARIVKDTMIDTGLEVHRIFTIEATVDEEKTTFDISPTIFASMAWVYDAIGARAYIFPGHTVKDHARTAIQMFSQDSVETRRVYGHLGWREIDGDWYYLHIGGAIGASGNTPGITVELNDALARFELPEPPANPKAATLASLDFLNIAPQHITLLLFGYIFRSAIKTGDVSIHITGQSGIGKTQLAALMQQFFGKTMVDRYLPASWESTENQLESLAFMAKDALLVIDEFTPSERLSQAALQRKAERLFRGQANSRGRGRADRTGKAQADKPPRGSIVATGEDRLQGESLNARVITVEMTKGDVDFEKLSKCQSDALQGLYAQVLAAFLQWLAPRYPQVLAHWEADMAALRTAFGTDDAHRRTASNLASLAMGWVCFLRFCVDIGMYSTEAAEVTWSGIASQLTASGQRQSEHIQSSNAAVKFVDLLSQGLGAGLAHVSDTNGHPPNHAEAFGWREDARSRELKAQGEKIGWIDGEELYLIPEVTYGVIEQIAARSGSSLMLTPRSLWKRLKTEGLLTKEESSRETCKVRVTHFGRRLNVVVLKADLNPAELSPSAPKKAFPKKLTALQSWNL